MDIYEESVKIPFPFSVILSYSTNSQKHLSFNVSRYNNLFIKTLYAFRILRRVVMEERPFHL